MSKHYDYIAIGGGSGGIASSRCLLPGIVSSVAPLRRGMIHSS
jgi:hypothetical protein